VKEKMSLGKEIGLCNLSPITNITYSWENIISSKTAKYASERRFGCFHFTTFSPQKACF